jgi:coenzyme F420-reducing hydrogenase delta subunit
LPIIFLYRREMDKEIPEIYLFYCSGSDGAAEVVRSFAGVCGVKVVPVPCSGKIDILYITKAFENGAEGVAVLTCPRGECRYLEGNLRAEKRMESIGALLEEIGLGKGRATAIQVGHGQTQQAAAELERFCARINSLKMTSAGVPA